MIEIAIYSKDQLRENFSISRRLSSRIGTLLSKSIAVSAMVLEEAVAGSEIEKLLLSSSFREVSSEGIVNILATIQQTKEFSIIATDFPLTIIEQGEWKVIASEEEIEAENGFSSINSDESSELSLTEFSVNSLNLNHNDYGSVNAIGNNTKLNYCANSELSDINSFRISIFAGETSAERVSALRKLLFANFDKDIKVSIFIKALAENENILRAAAAVALKSVGLDSEVSETIRLLSEGDVLEKIYAAKRLSHSISISSPEIEKNATIMAILGGLRSEDDYDVLNILIKTIADAGLIVDGFSSIITEVCRLLIEKAVGNLKQLGDSVKYSFRKFKSSYPIIISKYLLDEYYKTENLDIKSFLLICAVFGETPDEEKQKYIKAACECLLALPAESSASHILGTFLINSGDCGVEVVLGAYETSDISHKRFFVRILDNAVRFNNLSPEMIEMIASKIIITLKTSSKNLLNDIFETRVLTSYCLPSELKITIAKGICDAIRQFSLPQVLNNIENNLVRLGADIIPVLGKYAKDYINTKTGTICCAAAGRIANDSLVANSEHARCLRELLREMQKMSFSETKNINDVFLVMGIICSNNVIEKNIIDIINKNFYSRLRGSAEDAPLIRSIGFTVKNVSSTQEDIAKIIEIALSHLKNADSKATLCSENIAGEDVFTFSGEVNVDSDLIPACIEAIGHAVLSDNAEVGLRKSTCEVLLNLWRACSKFTVQWSPGNVSLLTALLGRIGTSENIMDEQKLEIVYTLSRRLSDIPILEALTAIIIANKEIKEFNRLAAVIVLRIFETIEKDKDITNEDKEVYLMILQKIAKRGVFETRRGTSEEILTRIIDEIFIGIRDGVSGSLILISDLKDSGSLSMKLKEYIETNLKPYTSIKKATL